MQPAADAGRSSLRRRGHLHSVRLLQARRLRRRGADRVRRSGSVSRRRLRRRHGRVLDPTQARRHPVRRRQRLHPNRHLHVGRVHRFPADPLPRQGPVSRSRRVRPRDGSLLQSLEAGEARRHRVRRRQRLHRGRRLPRGRVHWHQSGRVPAERPVPRGRRLRSRDRSLLQSTQGRRRNLRRRERLHARGRVQRRDMHRQQPRGVHRRGPVS